MRIKTKEDVGAQITKRPSGKASIYVWSILLFAWLSFVVHLWLIGCFENGKESEKLFAIVNVPTVVFLMGISYISYKSYKVGIDEFLIHSFDKWNSKTGDYERLFIVEEVEVCSEFIFLKFIGNFKYKMSDKQIENTCKSADEIFHLSVYESEDEAMQNIIYRIKEEIARGKKVDKVKIINISTHKSIGFDEALKSFESGEYNYLTENKK